MPKLSEKTKMLVQLCRRASQDVGEENDVKTTFDILDSVEMYMF